MAGRPEDDQLERDIAEALKRGGADRLPSRGSKGAGSRRGGIDLRLSSPRPVMIAGGVLFALSWFHILGSWALTLGLAIFAFGLITWLLRPRRSDMYWRGRRIEEAPPWWVDRVYFTLYRHG